MTPRRIVFFLTFVLVLAGCSQYGPEELDRLTKEDPNFKQMIVSRDQIHAQVHAIKEDLLAKKKAMDEQVDKLRRDYDAYSKAQNQKIEKYESVIDANRNLLKREVETAEADLDAKSAELDRLQKTLADVEKVLRQSHDLTLSAPERQKWEERRLMISEKIKPLTDDMQELKAKISLGKRKVSFLK